MTDEGFLRGLNNLKNKNTLYTFLNEVYKECLASFK